MGWWKLEDRFLTNCLAFLRLVSSITAVTSSSAALALVRLVARSKIMIPISTSTIRHTHFGQESSRTPISVKISWKFQTNLHVDIDS